MDIKVDKTKIRKKKIETSHGTINTPAFLPDATYGTIKALSWKDAKKAGVEQLVSTTLHLEQTADSKYIKQFGGIHEFYGWDRPILTDSGGYQVFSLIFRNPNDNNHISEAGCTFKNFKTGSYTFLSPEISQVIQHNLGADIVTVLDVPLRNDATTHETREAINRNTRWAKRSKDMFLKLHNLTEADFDNPKVKRPLIGAVVQGGNNKELRKQSAESLVEIGFDLYNFGGPPIHNDKSWHNDAPKGFHREMLAYVASLLPEDKIRYAMGIGSPDDIIFSAQHGWDIFDTVLPTRNARHGYIYVSKGLGDMEFENYDVMHVRSKRYEYSKDPIDKIIANPELDGVSRAYLRHLIRTKDGAGFRLASIQNLAFYAEVMRELQK